MNLVELKENEYRLFTENNHAHFLQSYEWGELSRKKGITPIYLGLKENSQILATALLLEKDLLLGYKYYYIPRFYTIDYHNYELIKIFTMEIKKFCKSRKGVFFRIDPAIKLHTIDENANKIDGENNYQLVECFKKIGFKGRPLTKYFETTQPRYTFRIDLKDDLETIEKRYSTTTTQRIKKALKYGVKVEKGTISDIKEFSRLMLLTEKRQDFYSHSENFYTRFFDTFSKNNMVTLYLGKVNPFKIYQELTSELDNYLKELDSIKDLDNKKANGLKKELEKNINSVKEQIDFFKDKPDEEIVVSSYLIVHYNGISWALYAANDMEYKRLFANYLVYQVQIKDAKERGDYLFDVFGTIGEPNSTSHLIGLHDFKKKWGGEYTEFVGEFDYILNPLMYLVYSKLIPLRHKMINKKLRKKMK